MKPESSREFSKLHWALMYSAWILGELVSIAAFGYSIYSIIIMICGDWSGAAVFAGIIPGFTLFVVILYLCKRAKIPWRAGDYQWENPRTYKIRQVRAFHTILWSVDEGKGYSKAVPHLRIDPDKLDPIGRKYESLVYQSHGSSRGKIGGWKRFLIYVRVTFWEVLVLAVFSLSVWFMVWAGIKTSLSFLSGSLLPFSGIGAHCCAQLKKDSQSPSKIHVAGLTWVIVENHGSLYLRNFMFSLMGSPIWMSF